MESVSFKYGDNTLTTNMNLLKAHVYYSTDNWATSSALTTTPLDYLNTTMQTFTATGINAVIAGGQVFSVRIYPYTPNGSMAMTPTFAVHNSVAICGNTNTLNTTTNTPANLAVDVIPVAIEQNTPNPFAYSSTINYNIPRSGHVTIRVYNSIGETARVLVDEVKSAGRSSVDFNAEGLSNGIYFYSIQAEGITQTKKMMIVK